MLREERDEMLGNTDGTHSRTSTSMRDAKGFVEVEMTNIGADITGTTETDHCIHVGTIKIDLTSNRVNDVADLFDRLFKDTKGRRIGHHNGGDTISVCIGL